MTQKITFFRDQFGAPASNPVDDSFSALGSLLTSDVQGAHSWCLDLLSWIEDVQAGRSEEESWLGNSWSGDLTKQGFEINDLYSDDWTGSYSLADTHAVVLDYFNFIASAPSTRNTAVNTWEAKNGRPHPCRPHLGL